MLGGSGTDAEEWFGAQPRLFTAAEDVFGIKIRRAPVASPSGTPRRRKSLVFRSIEFYNRSQADCVMRVIALSQQVSSRGADFEIRFLDDRFDGFSSAWRLRI